ncbi:hypothetical protein BaRGS_00035676 [Batillaria attramentaria]|uniref:MACPF domain-containing protein n=1 Tax=Batillaria attramentaria TaxID=370345 RepID=A0ABD0JFE5_9CAEN
MASGKSESIELVHQDDTPRNATEVYLENIRLREQCQTSDAGGAASGMSLADSMKLLIKDNKDIKYSMRKEKKQRRWSWICVGLVVAFQFVLILAIVSLAGVAVYRENKKPAASQEPQAPMAMLQPLPVNPLQTSDSGEPAPLSKYYFNVGPRQDYLLQECQGPQLKRSFPDMDYALLGYNVLKGYPLAVGHDPGFTLPIFSADYSAGHMTADCRYSVPKGIILIPDVSCITSFSSDVVQTSYELSKSLSVSAHASGGGWGVSFSASAGYKESSSQVATGESVFIISRASCNYYYMKLLQRDAPPFHPVFLDWIVELNQTEHDDVYIDFIENYGTHFLTEVKFGASFTYEHKMTTSSFKEETQKGVNVAVSASYSGLFSVGGGFSMDSSQKEAASSFQKKVTTRTITIGAAPPANGDAMTWASTVKESPVPMSYDLQSIEDLFSETFMDGDYMKQYGIDYQRIKTKIGETKQKYCARLRDQGLVDVCAELSPGLVMPKTRLYGHFATTKTQTKGQCIDECFKRTSCVAMTFCEGCGDTACYMYKEEMRFRAEKDDDWTSMFILPEIENLLVLANTDIKSNNRRSIESDEEVTTFDSCQSHCLRDIYCAAFTFCECPEQKEKCTLYSEKDMSLVRMVGMTTYFMSPRKQREEIGIAATTAAPGNETTGSN